MVQYIPDRTGRFSQRPYFEPDELDRECENIIFNFLKENYGEVTFPISTDDLTRLIERESEDLDLYADLTDYGADVEGLTEWCEQRPCVKISALLAANGYRENRLRTTLTHEYGHVHFHTALWELETSQRDLLMRSPNANKQLCKRSTISNATQTDWMEWQAGYACGALLMPASHVRSLVGLYKEKHSLFGPVGYTNKHGEMLISVVQTTYQVSVAAARIRLLKLNVFGESGTDPPLFGR